MAVFVFNTPQLFINTPQPVILPKTMSTSKELLPANKLDYIDRNILHYLYNNPKLSDIEFIVNDKRFPANRCVMSAASDVFEAMLFGTFQESSSSDINIGDVVHTESFSSLLSYIYDTGIQVDSLRAEVAMEVLKLGHFYGLPKLCEALENYFSNLDLEIKSEYSLGTNVFMELLNVAFTYKIVELYDRMKNIIKSSTENVNKFLEHSELVNITCPILEDIFEADNFCIDEVEILGAVMKWIDANVTETNFDFIPKNDENELLVTKTANCKVTEGDCTVKTSDSGTELSSDTDDQKFSFGFGFKTNEEVVTEHESDGTSSSGISRLLQTIRSRRLSTFDGSKFWRENSSLYKKYKLIVTGMIPYLDNQNPRKPLIQKRILIKCDNNSKISEPVIYDTLEFYLKVSQNTQSSDVSVQLVVKYLNCNCSEAERSVSMSYSLFLKSFRPFKKGYFVERNKALCTRVLKNTKPTQKFCTHGYGIQNCPSCLLRTSGTSTEIIAITSTLPNTLKNKKCQFINNSSFILEAFIEFN